MTVNDPGHPHNIGVTDIDLTEALEHLETETTRRTMVEASLKQQNELLTNITESAPIRIFWKDLDGLYLGCNTLFARDAGFSRPQELIGKSDYDMGWRDQAELYRADDQAVMNSGEARLGFEEPQTTPDGETIWLRTSKVPLRDAHDHVIGILGIYEDITRHRQSEASLATSEKKLRTILDNVDAYIYLKDSEGRYLFANRLVRELWHVEMEDVVGFGDEKFFDADSAMNIRNNDNRVLRHGETVRSEESNTVTTTGESKVYQSTKLPLYRDDGTIYALCGISTDITNRKRIEDQLRASESRFRDLFEKSPDPCWMINEENLFTLCNQAAADLLEYDSIEELTATHPSKLSPAIQPDGRESFEKANAMMAEAHTKGVHRFEWEHQRKNGECFPVEVTLAEIEIDAKKQLYCIWRDISERKKTEQKLLESSRHSESLLRLFKALERAQNHQQCIEAVAREIETVIGYRTSWLFLISDDGETATMLSARPSDQIANLEPIRNLNIRGDRYLEESASATEAVVIADARTDPRTNKEIVAMMGNRSIVNVPVFVSEQCKAVFGAGSFGNEGILVPSQPQLAYLEAVANQLSVTLNRLALEQQRNDAEERLRVSEERFQLAMAGANDGLWDWNLETNEIYYSPRWFSMLGYHSGDGLPGTLETWERLVHPDDRNRVLALVADYLEGRADHFDVEARMRHKNGQIVFVLARARMVCNKENKPVRLVGTHVDITQRKQNEANLKESISLQQATLEATADGILVVNSSGQWSTFNQKFIRMWHITDDILNSGDDQKALNYVLNQLVDPQAFIDKVVQLYNHPETTSFDILHFRDGRVFERYSMEQRLGGEIVGRVWSFRDVSDHYLAQERLRSSEERLRIAMETAGQGWLDLHIPTGETIVSPEIPEMLGYSIAEYRPGMENLAQSLHPDDRQRVLAIVDQCIRETGRERVEYRRKRKDGEWKWLDTIIQVVERDANGNAIRLIGMLADIDKRKEAEQRIVESEAALKEAQRISHLGSWHVELATGKVHWSEELYTMYGFDPSQPPPLLDDSNTLFTRESWERLSTAIARALETGESYELELELLPGGGSTKWMWARGEVVHDAHGTPVRLQGVVLDITERKQAEERIRLYQEIYALSNDVIAIINSDGHCCPVKHG